MIVAKVFMTALGLWAILVTLTAMNELRQVRGGWSYLMAVLAMSVLAIGYMWS